MPTKIIDYGSDGWSYRDGLQDHDLGFEDPDFDVSAWTVGAMAFGGTNTPEWEGHPRGTLVAHASASGVVQDLTVRRDLGAGIDGVRVLVAADDGVRIWLNGVQFHSDLTVTRTGGPTYVNVVAVAPSSLLGGDNVLAIRRRDLVNPNGGTWLDVRVEITTAGWSVGRVGMQ